MDSRQAAFATNISRDGEGGDVKGRVGGGHGED
jgi:hypothetical protein